MRELIFVEIQNFRGGSAGAKAADCAGVVPVLVMRAAHRRADARRDLVADDDRAQEIRLARAERVRGGDGGCAGMVDAIAVDVVDFDGMRGGAVNERHGAWIAALELFGERL